MKVLPLPYPLAEGVTFTLPLTFQITFTFYQRALPLPFTWEITFYLLSGLRVITRVIVAEQLKKYSYSVQWLVVGFTLHGIDDNDYSWCLLLSRSTNTSLQAR